MATFSQKKSALDEISDVIVTTRNNLTSARNQVASASTTLVGLSATYGALITEIGDDAVNNPNDDLTQMVKAEADKLVAEYQILKTHADAVLAAIDGAW